MNQVTLDSLVGDYFDGIFEDFNKGEPLYLNNDEVSEEVIDVLKRNTFYKVTVAKDVPFIGHKIVGGINEGNYEGKKTIYRIEIALQQ